LEQLESLPSHVSPTENERTQIAKTLGSGDLFTPLTGDAIIKERHGL
jgi:hypothetical protein